MRNKVLLLFTTIVLVAMVLPSCVTYKDVRYLQDMPKEGLPISENLEATIAPYDELRIYVFSHSGKDDELLKPFNSLRYTAQGAGAGSQLGYLVDAEGNIEFPVLGKLHVEGLTRNQIQDTISSQLQSEGYIKDPLVVARFLNFRVYFLTSSGGSVLNITNERCTFLEALAMAGGMDWYTRRDRIGVMREVDGKRVIHYLDPRSTAVFDDEFYLLQQNDIIFTEERSWKFFTNNMSAILAPISILTSTLAVYTLVETFIKNHQ
jgi:polysaccharide export outer membrane protein